MTSTYQTLAEIAQSAGLVYFVGIFLSVVIYALWPGNKAKFDSAAHVPLQDD
jgi:cytochrome c oxidase cbb3-type subunit IV